MVLSNSTNIIIIVGTILFFSSAITMLILILRKRFLRDTIKVCFVSKGGHIERSRYKQKDIGTTIKNGRKRYKFDPKAVLTTFWGKEIYFSKETTNPLYFNEQGEIDTSKINSENLNAIIETELIAKLFKDEIFNTENILLLVSIVLSIVGIVLLLVIKTKGVQIANTPENIALLKDVLTQVIKGV